MGDVGFTTLTMWLLFIGIIAAVLAGLSRNTTADGLVLGGAAFSAFAGVAVLVSVNACRVDWQGEMRCFNEGSRQWMTIAGGAGIAQGLLLALVVGVDPRSWVKRVLLGACVPLAACLFSLTIFSIGILLIPMWLGTLGWLIVKAPPMRAAGVSDVT